MSRICVCYDKRVHQKWSDGWQLLYITSAYWTCTLHNSVDKRFDLLASSRRTVKSAQSLEHVNNFDCDKIWLCNCPKKIKEKKHNQTNPHIQMTNFWSISRFYFLNRPSTTNKAEKRHSQKQNLHPDVLRQAQRKVFHSSIQLNEKNPCWQRIMYR